MEWEVFWNEKYAMRGNFKVTSFETVVHWFLLLIETSFPLNASKPEEAALVKMV